MKKKLFIFCLLSCTVIGTATEYQSKPTIEEPPQASVAPHVRPVPEVIEIDKAYALPTKSPPIGNNSAQSSTLPTDNKSDESTPKPALTQGAEKDEPTITPTPTTPTSTKPTTPSPAEPSTPKMGDTRIVDGKQQSYFLGFGWVDYLCDNEVIHLEDMYENGNKVGIMGDINKTVGIMD